MTPLHSLVFSTAHAAHVSAIVPCVGVAKGRGEEGKALRERERLQLDQHVLNAIVAPWAALGLERSS